MDYERAIYIAKEIMNASASLWSLFRYDMVSVLGI